MGRATEILIDQYAVDHVDLNFGCPVPKVAGKGGGGALPYKRRWLDLILTAVVGAARPYGVPVTMKTRMGIDHDHQTYLDAGRIAEQSGCAAIALHGRTVQQSYSGEADWEAIAALKQHVSIPVLGNGDIWEASDALEMVRRTGVDGVVIGRGCLGRPWLFRDLVDAFAGVETRTLPDAGRGGGHGPAARRAAGRLLRRAARAARDAQAHGLVLQGLPGRGETRGALGVVSSFAELDTASAQLDPDVLSRSPSWGRRAGGRVRRGTRWRCPTAGSTTPPAVDLDLAEAEIGISGG